MTYEKITDLLVLKILQAPHNHVWKLQGIGKLQLDLDNDRSLHIWSPDHTFYNVSRIHTHPWGFKSCVVWGELTNQQYNEITVNRPAEFTHKWSEVNLDTGNLSGNFYYTRLVPHRPEIHRSNNSAFYNQGFDDIHETSAIPGTVTILERRRHSDSRVARVFWGMENFFGSAQPRIALASEVREITELALMRYNIERKL